MEMQLRKLVLLHSTHLIFSKFSKRFTTWKGNDFYIRPGKNRQLITDIRCNSLNNSVTVVLFPSSNCSVHVFVGTVSSCVTCLQRITALWCWWYRFTSCFLKILFAKCRELIQITWFYVVFPRFCTDFSPQIPCPILRAAAPQIATHTSMPFRGSRKESRSTAIGAHCASWIRRRIVSSPIR